MPKTGLEIKEDALTKQVISYNQTHNYVNFAANDSLLFGGPNALISNYILGSFGPSPENPDNGLAQMMSPYDSNNLHSISSAAFNISQLYSQIKAKQQSDNAPALTIVPGLNLITAPGSFIPTANGMPDLTYFLKKTASTTIVTTVNTPLNITTFPSSVEWTGFFQSTTSGIYSFKTIQNAFIWVGDIALVGYTIMNTLKSNNTLNVTAKQLYPIRIQYTVTNANQLLSSFIQLYQGQTQLDITKYLNTVTLNGSRWEPVQIFFSLQPRQNNLNSIMSTKYDTTNNYTINQSIRKLKTVSQLTYNTRWSVPNITSFKFNQNGEIILNDSTKLNPNTNSITCIGGTNVSGILLTMGGQIYTSDQLNISNNNNSYIITVPTSSALPDRKNTGKYNINLQYNIGSNVKNLNFTKASGQTMVINITPVINTCAYTLQLIPNTGDLIVKNVLNPKIWSLRAYLKQPFTANTQSNPVWLSEYQSGLANGMDLSILLPNSTILNDGKKYLISSDGKYKLTISQDNTLNLYYCTVYNKTVDDPTRNIICLYGIIADPKTGGTFLANNANKTLQSIVQGPILQYADTYSINSTQMGLNYPPVNSTTSYKSFADTNNAKCAIKCNADTNCSSYYSTTVGNKTNCIINTNRQLNLYPNQPNSGITNSKLYIRNQKVNGSEFSTKSIYSPNKTPQIISADTIDKYMQYQAYTPGNTIGTECTQEGAWRDSSILTSYNSYMGGTPTIVTSACKENFTGNLYTRKPIGLWDDMSSCDGTGGVSSSNVVNCKSQLSTNILDLSNNYLPNYLDNVNDISQNYYDISRNKIIYDGLFANYGTVGSKYDVIDNSGNLTFNNNNPMNGTMNLKDIQLSDANDNLMQQNLMYITGVITSATLIIAAIYIGQG